MFLLVLRKLTSNRWLALCLLLGAIIAVALAAGIPEYTQGILQRMLTRDLEIFQESTGYFTGRYSVSVSFYRYSDEQGPDNTFAPYERTIRDRLAPEVELPVLASTQQIVVDFLQGVPAVQREDRPAERYLRLVANSDAERHVKILQGRLPASRPVDEAIEVMVSEGAIKSLDLLVGESYVVTDIRELLPQPMVMKVVGVFGMADPGDPWWFQSLRNYEDAFVADYGLLRSMYAEPQSPLLTGATWSFAFDYHAITVGDLGRLTRVLDDQVKLIEDYQVSYELPMLSTLHAYFDRARTLTTLLWFLEVPVFIMLAFFVFMTSQLIVRHDSSEIAVLKSRGARSRQIFLAYLLEGLLMSLTALIVGPPLGLLVCKVVGATNGFLEFVQRTSLKVALSGQSYAAAGACAVLVTATMLVPTIAASRTTIVIAKQLRSRAGRAPLWRRAFLDVAMLVISGYGWYAYRTQQTVLALTRIGAGQLPLDPLLFVISALFIVGAGLFAIRVYPLVVGIVCRAGKRIWPPELYGTFLGVARSGGQEQFLMLFLALTLAIGVLDARTARTINANVEERIRYAAGADLTVLEDWPTNRPKDEAPGGPDFPGMPSAPAEAQVPLEYREPDFQKYTTLEGVAAVTKVFRRAEAFAYPSRGSPSRATVMGIVPNEFAQVAWFRPGMLPYHWNNYLNLLAQSPKAMLVSESFAKKNELKPGDSISITWEGQDYLDGTIYGIVPFWPTWNPYGVPPAPVEELVVANLAYLHAGLAIEPYEVWMKLGPGGTTAQVYEQLEAKRVALLYVHNSVQDLVTARNDPMLQGTNGALTLGFTVTMLVTVIGFLIYWIIAIESRSMQFGVLRAMGMTSRRVVAMIAWEQLMVSGVAIVIGVLIGGAAADLFVPLLQLTSSAAQQVPPFRVAAARIDYLRLYAVVGVMLAAGFAILGAIVSRLRVAQAIKLGEE